MHDLGATGRLARIFFVTGVGPTVYGRNGGGDRYFTDGELAVGILVSRDAPGVRAAEVLRARRPSS